MLATGERHRLGRGSRTAAGSSPGRAVLRAQASLCYNNKHKTSITTLRSQHVGVPDATGKNRHNQLRLT